MGRHKRTTRETLEEFPVPTAPTECIVRIVAPQGVHLHKVHVPLTDASRIAATLITDLKDPPRRRRFLEPCQTGDNSVPLVETLCKLPTRFRNAVFVKRGSFVIADLGSLDGSTKVGGEIQHVLYPRQIEHIKRQGLWPPAFTVSKPAGESGYDILSDTPQKNPNHAHYNELDATDSDSDTDSDTEPNDTS
ncbi:phosphatidylserine decarboxylase 1 [Dispira simplex]|nr:phosphatidylserine decarboxylase 1 [Dispira simplex]